MPPSTSQPLLPRSHSSSAVPKGKGCWSGPGKITTVVNGLTFRSTFDSGNLARVALPAEQGGVGGVYKLWTARDCEGGPNAKRNSSWFYFGVAGGSANQIITMRIMNLNNQYALYKYGMTPVFRLSGNPNWARLKQKVVFEEEGRHLQLEFQFRFTRDSEEVLFAFCFPYSYDDCNKDIERCEDQARRDGMAVQALLTPQPGPTGYFHRELLIRTPEGRRVDLLTVTDCHGILDEREPQIDPHVFPEQVPSERRPFEFKGKDVIFVSARVHPGETPASFVFQGILRFLLDPSDPRAAELRRRFIFKLVPLLNPDGIAAGHFRQDSYGNNLNRHYVDPDVEKHSSVYAAKAVVMHHAARPAGRGWLTLYLDLHAHASARGCFMYGNHLPNLDDQAENQLLPLLMTVNTPHFDYASCNFTLKHMSRVDSGDSGLSAEGTGRVFYGTHAGVLRSYTLECNYNTGKAMCNHVPPASEGKGGGRFASPERRATTPPRYHPQIWRDVGAGFLKALLDAEGASVWSRLPHSKFRSLERAKRYLVNELRSQPSYREQSLLLRRGASTAATTTAATAATSAPLPLPPPPHEKEQAPPSSPTPPHRSKNNTGNNSSVGTTRVASHPLLLSGKMLNFAEKVPAATVTPAAAKPAGRGGGGAFSSGGSTSTATGSRNYSRPPLTLLPRRPGKTPPVGQSVVVSSRSQPEGSVRGTPGLGSGGRGGRGGGGGGGGGVPIPNLAMNSNSSSSSASSGRRSGGSGHRSGAQVSVNSGSGGGRGGRGSSRTAAEAPRRQPASSSNSVGHHRSSVSRAARREHHAMGRSSRSRSRSNRRAPAVTPRGSSFEISGL
ncbi:unnamed protein product [Pylaiella littoralis]